MRVIRAEHAGACYGVLRALNLADEALSAGKTTTSLGPLIHNPLVVSEYEHKGLHIAVCPDDVAQGTVLIRSHGVPPEIRQRIDELGLDCIDATCPHVLRAQSAAENLAREIGFVVIVGEAGHPEVQGVAAYVKRAQADFCIAARPADLPSDLPARVGVVVQTTQTKSALDNIVETLTNRGIDVTISDTICNATSLRQKAASALAATVDLMLVVGGANSSNTNRLAEICQEVCDKTFLVESSDQIDSAWFAGVATVGITAGASTPESHIAAVEHYIEAL